MSIPKQASKFRVRGKGDFMYSILIVDDEITICKGIKFLIEKLDSNDIGEVLTAFSGEEAENLCSKVKPDIIITDICMPGLSGLELIRRLKESGSSSKIIVLSAHSEFEYARSAFKLGIEDYLLKPTRISKLREVLQVVISDLKGRRHTGEEYDHHELIIREGELQAPEEKNQDNNLIDMAKRYISQNYHKDIDMATVANSLSMNYSYFSRWFKTQTSKNFCDYLTEVRMEEAKKKLVDPSVKIYEISSMVGYDNPKRFTRLFKGYFGFSPEEYRKKL
jgi:two-component system, response regulator YesN